jgi:L-ribulokinase
MAIKPRILQSLDPRLEYLTTAKLRDVVPLGTKAGGLTAGGITDLKKTYYCRNDAHAAVPAVGVVTPGKQMTIHFQSLAIGFRRKAS